MELTAIEKGRLINILNQPTEGFTATAGEPIPSSALTGKDMKHLSLQSDLRQKSRRSLASIRQSDKCAAARCVPVYTDG